MEIQNNTPQTPVKPALDIKTSLIIFLLITNLFSLSYILIKKPTTPTKISINSPQPTQSVVNPTPAWQTYTNSQFGFEIKYPLDWQILAPSYVGNITNIKSPIASDKVFGAEPEILYYSVSINLINNSFIGYVDEMDQTYKFIYETKKIGEYTVRVSRNIPDAFENIRYFFENKEKNIVIEFVLTPYSDDNNYPDQKIAYNKFIQILSTFKFTDPISTIPSDWIKETDIGLGISFYHPQNWYKYSYEDNYKQGILWHQSCKQYPECLTISFEKTQKTANDLQSEICINDGAVDNTDVVPKQVLINGYSATSFEYGAAIGGTFIKILINKPNGDNILVEHLYSEVDEVNQILSTFKFTD